MPLKVDLLRRHAVLSPEDALSYRIPLPVTRMYRNSRGSEFPLCPRCDRCVDREYMRFCSCCGQRLSWESLSSANVLR